MFRRRKKGVASRSTHHRVFLKSGGFTLIEVLVVVAIIALLASIILASLNAARSKARDSRRIQDVKAIETALALYYSKHNTYPACSFPTNDVAGHIISIQCLETALKSDDDIPSIPNDPSYPNASYAYDRNAQGNACKPPYVAAQEYRLWAALENSTTAQQGLWWTSKYFGSWACSS